ncbi:MAG: hypothetical protein ACKOEV_04610 [Cytophagales bacterium]
MAVAERTVFQGTAISQARSVTACPQRLTFCYKLLQTIGDGGAFTMQTNKIMKAKSLITLTVLFCCFTAFAQSNEKAIAFKFKNTSLLPKKLTLLSYSPGEAGNGTQAFWMWPSSTKQFSFKEGTKLYKANQKQVDAVMSGSRIDNEKHFLIVTKDTAGTTVTF